MLRWLALLRVLAPPSTRGRKLSKFVPPGGARRIIRGRGHGVMPLVNILPMLSSSSSSSSSSSFLPSAHHHHHPTLLPPAFACPHPAYMGHRARLAHVEGPPSPKEEEPLFSQTPRPYVALVERPSSELGTGARWHEGRRRACMSMRHPPACGSPLSFFSTPVGRASTRLVTRDTRWLRAKIKPQAGGT